MPQRIAKDSFVVVDPKTGTNHYIEKGESRSSTDKLVKLAPWAYTSPESLAVKDTPTFGPGDGKTGGGHA